jgi:DNA-binding MarR family transcriptional regulator
MATPQQLAISVWTGLHQADAQLRTELGRRLEAGNELSLVEFELLTMAAHRPDPGLCMHEFAAGLVLSRGGVTKLVDRLVERGLLERRLLPENRRVVFATPTNEGWAVLERAGKTYAEVFDELVGSRLNERDLADLRRIAGRLGTEGPGCPTRDA